MSAAQPMKPPCGGKTRRGSPCPLPAGWGTNHVGVGRCKMHGGASPNAEVAGQVALARRDYQVMGRPLDVHPHEALLECIRIAAGEVGYASDRIADLQDAEAVGPVRTVTIRPLKTERGAEDPTERAQEIRVESPQLHIWIQVRQKAMDRLVTYSATAMRAGVEERMVRVAESQAQQLAGAVRGILDELGMANHPDAPRIVRKHLMVLSGTVQRQLAA